MEGTREPGDGDAPRPLSGRVRPGAPRVAALDALLRDIDGLRMTLQTDLSLAAGALEAGEPELSASVLDSDRHDVAAFERRALGHLAALRAADAAEAAEAAPAGAADGLLHLPVHRDRRAPRRLPRRLTRFLPATPLVATAAALIGLFGVSPGLTDRQASTGDVSGAVLSSWAELTRLSADDAPADEVQRAARSLHADLVRMVARADGDPAAARQALQMLTEAEAVLSADDDAAEFAAVLEQSRALAARLLAGLPPLPPALPTLPSGLETDRPLDADRPPVAATPLPRAVPPTVDPAVRPAPRRSPDARTPPTRVPRPRSGSGTTASRPASTPPSTPPSIAPSAEAAPTDPVPRASRPAGLPNGDVDPFLQ